MTTEKAHQAQSNTSEPLINQPLSPPIDLYSHPNQPHHQVEMTFLSPLVAYPAPQIKETLLEHSKGKSIDSLQTPALLIKKSVVQDNCTRLLKRVDYLGYRFRAHVKTHKTIEITKQQLGYDLPNYDGRKYDSIVVSTLKEAYAVINYQESTGEIFINDIVYGLPNITEDTLLHILELSKKVKHFRLLIDNVEHIKILKAFNDKYNVEAPWSIFIKLDAGTARAGIEKPQVLSQVLSEVLLNSHLSLYGFYVHAGHSYSSNNVEESENHFLEELQCVSDAVNLLEHIAPELNFKDIVVSVGATPTLHSLEHDLYTGTSKKIEDLLSNLKATLEVHAGNYGLCDLQQVSTGCVNTGNVGLHVLTSVISQYPQRKHPIGELLTNSGVIALSREPSPKFTGFGRVVTDPKYGEWEVNRLSQEHGILRPVGKSLEEGKLIPIGTKVKIIPNHACITANSFNAYYVLDDNETIIDVYIPWRGW